MSMPPEAMQPGQPWQPERPGNHPSPNWSNGHVPAPAGSWQEADRSRQAGGQSWNGAGSWNGGQASWQEPQAAQGSPDPGQSYGYGGAPQGPQPSQQGQQGYGGYGYGGGQPQQPQGPSQPAYGAPPEHGGGVFDRQEQGRGAGAYGAAVPQQAGGYGGPPQSQQGYGPNADPFGVYGGQPGAQAFDPGAEAERSAAKRMIIFGAIWFAVGLVITVGSLALASSNGGGVYFVSWGPMLYGVIRMIQGGIKLGRS